MADTIFLNEPNEGGVFLALSKRLSEGWLLMIMLATDDAECF